MTHTVERIGKKYQWLALYELGARLADNCAFIGGWSGDRKPERYDGESFGFLRDLDPSLLIPGTHDDSSTNLEGVCWWAPIHPDLRPTSTAEKIYWLYGETDWIDNDKCIDVTDPADGGRWLVLSGFVRVQERARDALAGHSRETWSRVSCVVVEKTAWKNLLRGIEKRLLTDPRAVPKMELYSYHVYFGEYPWHPGWLRLQEEWDGDFGVHGVPTSVRPTVTEYVCEGGNHDASVTQAVNVTLPAPWLIEAMGLHLSDGRRATFDDASKVKRFFDPSVTAAGPQAGLVDRNAFLATLDRAGLAPLWVIAGEKGVYGGMGDRFGGRRDFTSLYWLEKGTWNDPQPRHEEFQAHPAQRSRL